MMRMPVRSLIFLLALIAPALLPAQRQWVGMPVTAIEPGSQLREGLPPDLASEGLYLVEFNGTRFADTGTAAGRQNLQLLLKQWDDFRQAPPRDYTRLAFLQFEGRFAVLHRVELASWDGRLEIGTTPKPFELAADPEVRHHNAFIYLKTARQAQAAGELGKAKAYLSRVAVVDPKGAEAPQAADLLARIEAEERRQALEALLARADAERDAGRFAQAVALYQEALDTFGKEERVEGALAAAQQELQARLRAAEEARRQAEERRRLEEEQARLAKEQARVEAEARHQVQVQAEAADREREVGAHLTKARILREQGNLGEAAAALQAAIRLDEADPQVKAERQALSAAVARARMQEAKEARKAGRKGEALRLLREAAEWDPANKETEREIAALRQGIEPGEVDSMELAVLVWDPEQDMRFVVMPPASPESEAGRVFLWNGILDQEIDGSYLVKYGSKYEFCFVADFPLKGIHFNAGVKIIGEYIGNLTFTTVLGVPVQVPCLSAFYAE